MKNNNTLYIAGAALLGYYLYKSKNFGISAPNTKRLNENVFNYIISNIDSSGYGFNYSSDYDKLQFLADTFNDEYGYMKNRIGTQKALEEWYSGLPSAISLDFSYNDIIRLAKNWGSIPENAKASQENKITKNWFNFLAAKTLVLMRKNKIKI